MPHIRQNFSETALRTGKIYAIVESKKLYTPIAWPSGISRQTGKQTSAAQPQPGGGNFEKGVNLKHLFIYWYSF